MTLSGQKPVIYGKARVERVYTPFRCPSTLLEKVKADARDRRRSMNEVILQALEKCYGKEEVS